MIIRQENPPLVIGAPENENDVAQESGAVTYYFKMSWPANLCPNPSEVPPSFDAGLKDIEEGRLVDLDIALTQPPPSAQIPRD
jgi:hypothetical protein